MHYNESYCQLVNCLYTIDYYDKYGSIDQNGKIVFSPKFDFISEEPDSEGCYIFNENGKNHGYIDNNYRVHYLKYLIESFNEGFAAFEENNNYGFIDKKGVVVIKPKFKIRYYENTAIDIAYDFPPPFFSEGLCAIALSFSEEKKELLYGYINKNGKIVLKPKWLYVSPFKEGLAIVIDIQGNRYYINKLGTIILNLKSDEIGSCFYQNRAAICSDNDEVKKCYFIDKTGMQTSTIFDDAGDFHEGLAKVKKDGKWGFISDDGKYIISPVFLDVSDFSEGLASATVLDADSIIKTGIINTQGTLILSPEKDVRYGQFRCGIVSKYGSDGYIKAYVDQNDKIIWSK